MSLVRLHVRHILLGMSGLITLWLFVACVPLIRDSRAEPPRNATAPTPVLSNAQVSINNFTFTPDVITVTVGTTVTWRNRDDTPHTVTEANHLFGSKGLDTDDQFAFRFTDTGVYTYFCSIHPMMVGHVVVK